MEIRKTTRLVLDHLQNQHDAVSPGALVIQVIMASKYAIVDQLP